MGRLINMIMRVGMWGGLGALVGFVLTFGYEMAFGGGAMTFSSPNAMNGLMMGLCIGAVVGFFRRS